MLDTLALSDNGFLFDTRTGNTYTLNSTGSFLLRQLKSGTPVGDLADRLARTYDLVRTDAARRDVDDFLHRLCDLRLLESQEVRS